MTELVFSAGEARAVVDAENGGRLASLKVRGHEVLVGQDADPLAWGAYPMVPFAGRIRHGRFLFGGVDRQVPVTFGRHAMHGYGFVSNWDVVDDHTIELRLDDPWPFPAVVRQSFTMDEHGLTLTMEATAEADQPMMLGWHPWFRRDIGGDGDLSLDFDPAHMYELDDEAIPTGRLIDPPPGPWDNCFTNLGSDPVLRWGSVLELSLSSTADHWVVYDEPSHAMCIEPQSDAPDAVNRGRTRLSAGETMAISFSISW